MNHLSARTLLTMTLGALVSLGPASIALAAVPSATAGGSGQDAAGAAVRGRGAPPVTRIHAIQGNSDRSPLVGLTVRIDAIVVGDFQDGDGDSARNLRGFYVQEEDADADADVITSEGLFVFENGATEVDVQLGDRVQVTGTVDEFFGETRLQDISGVAVLSSANPLPTAALVTLVPRGPTTLSQGGRFQPDLEAYEGMRVRFADRLSITELFQLGRFNEIRLSQGGRLVQFAEVNAPDVQGFAEHLREIGSRTITYDDGLAVQNAPIGTLDGFGPIFSTATDRRIGDTVDGLSGVLSYQWAGNAASPATWRVRAVRDGENTFTKANLRQSLPEPVGESLRVAGFNVLNYFTTLPAAAPTAIGAFPRGAGNGEELDRQRQKLITALERLDADVLGLVELENDFLGGSAGNAIENLVDELNALAGAGTYRWVDPGRRFVGTDAIAVGLIYRPAAVTPVAMDILTFAENSAAATIALAEVLNPFVDQSDRVIDVQRTRPVLAVTFEDPEGERFTVAVNHLKSKSDSNLEDLAAAAQAALDGGATGFTQQDIDRLLADPNYDQLDGQDAWNALRAETAVELAQWLSDRSAAGYAGGAVSDPDVLIIGDLNAYSEEDPIRALEGQGFLDVARAFDPEPVSFVFSGQSGTLDYALASPSLLAQVTGATYWNINADEPSALDYNTDFNRDPTIFDPTVPFRASDHDPIVLGLTPGLQREVIFSNGFEGP